MKNVILIGLGAVGVTYAVKLKDKCNLSILADKKRINKYLKNAPEFNGEKQEFNYILPTANFDADLIIISVKANGLESVLDSLKNFISKKTHIISLINGISSEEMIKKRYPYANVIKTYFVGHSAVRINNKITQDGIGKVVTEPNKFLETFFKEAGINYSVSDNFEYSMWLKYTLNLFSNQTSAILNMTFGELKQNKNFLLFAKKIINEVKSIAEKKGIKGVENLEADSLNLLNQMCDEGKTSMLQDILAKRPTEADIFAGEIIKLGKKYNVETPCNNILYDLIKIKEEQNEHIIHSR